MGKRLAVEVTRDDIRRGIARSTRFCPIALAVRRAVPAARVRVGQSMLRINDEYMLVLPGAAQEFKDAFDKGRAVAPFSFELELPSDWVQVTGP